VETKKFDVEKLIKEKKILSTDFQIEIISKLKYKINIENKPLNKIMIDFGPYPLKREWLTKINKDSTQSKKSLGRGRSESKKVFLPPDEENCPSYGSKTLVIKYESSLFNLDPEEHLQS
jgi:hypothetical protein